MRVPEILFPLVAKGIVEEEQVLTFWHDTLLLIFPPGARLTMTYRPRTGYIYLIWRMTMGKPRDYDTGDVLTTDDYGFWHRHSQMRWHWDPGVESIYDVEYPHWLEVTEEDPVELEFYNDIDQDGDGEPDTTVIQDFSIWIFECSEEWWEKHVKPYVKGLYNLFKALGGLDVKDVAKFLKGKEVRR